MSQGYTITMALNGAAFNAMPADLKAMTSKLAERIVLVTTGPKVRNTERLENLDKYVLEKASENKYTSMVIRIHVESWDFFSKWYKDYDLSDSRQKGMRTEWLALPDDEKEPPSHWGSVPEKEWMLSTETHVYYDHMDVNEL